MASTCLRRPHPPCIFLEDASRFKPKRKQTGTSTILAPTFFDEAIIFRGLPPASHSPSSAFRKETCGCPSPGPAGLVQVPKSPSASKSPGGSACPAARSPRGAAGGAAVPRRQRLGPRGAPGRRLGRGARGAGLRVPGAGGRLLPPGEREHRAGHEGRSGQSRVGGITRGLTLPEGNHSPGQSNSSTFFMGKAEVLKALCFHSLFL